MADVVAKNWGALAVWSDESRRSYPEPEEPPAPASAMLFPTKGPSSANIQLLWQGADLLPRENHTAIWKINHTQMTGYYAVAWHTSHDGTWHASGYEYGTHPHPCDGTVLSSGQRAVGTSGSGEEHFFGVSGLGAFDYIASPGQQAAGQLEYGRWYTQARTAELINDGATVRHRYYIDLENDPDLFIQQDNSASWPTPVDPTFLFGSSPWATQECLGGMLTAIQLYDAALTAAEIVARMNLETDAAVVAADPGSLFYCNVLPTPTDVTDKSGNGHHPSWVNANRPTLVEL